MNNAGAKTNEKNGPKGPTRTEKVEASIEKVLETLTTHPLFLKSVAKVLDLNSNRILFTKNLLRYLWQQMELPIRKDQERTLYLIQELQFHIHKLESELLQMRQQQQQYQQSERAANNERAAASPRTRPEVRFSEAMKKTVQIENV